MKANKDELLQECQLVGLNEVYTEMVLRGKIDIDLAIQFQSEDEGWCCDGLGCAQCIPF